METKRYRVGITAILDAWNAEVDIEDYSIDKNGRLVIVYCMDERSTARIEARWVAGWFGGTFVEWAWDEKGGLDGMVIERKS